MVNSIKGSKKKIKIKIILHYINTKHTNDSLCFVRQHFKHHYYNWIDEVTEEGSQASSSSAAAIQGLTVRWENYQRQTVCTLSMYLLAEFCDLWIFFVLETMQRLLLYIIFLLNNVYTVHHLPIIRAGLAIIVVWLKIWRLTNHKEAFPPYKKKRERMHIHEQFLKCMRNLKNGSNSCNIKNWSNSCNKNGITRTFNNLKRDQISQDMLVNYIKGVKRKRKFWTLIPLLNKTAPAPDQSKAHSLQFNKTKSKLKLVVEHTH